MSGSPEVKYAFIRDHRDQFDVSIMCEISAVSRSGYYDWVTRNHDSREERLLKLRIDIEKAFDGSRGTYRSPRVFQILKGLGYEVSEDTVARTQTVEASMPAMISGISCLPLA